MTTNLSFMNWFYPRKSDVESDSNDSDNPKRLAIVDAIVSKDNRENDPSKDSNASGHTRDDSIGERVNMRHKREIGTVASLEKECHRGHEPEHGGMGVGIEDPDRDLESTSDDAECMQKDLLAPDLTRLGVEEIGHQASRRTTDDVQKTEHSSPATGTSLAEGLEVLKVVASEDGVDGQLGAEGAEVADRDNGGLWAEDNGHAFVEGGLDDYFTAGDGEHLLLAHGGFLIEGAVLGACDVGFLVQFLLVAG